MHLPPPKKKSEVNTVYGQWRPNILTSIHLPFGFWEMPTGDLATPVCHLRGTVVAQWLRCCATNRKVAGSIPASVSGFFIDIKSFRSQQEYFLEVKGAGV